jgi:hypothetical protein
MAEETPLTPAPMIATVLMFMIDELLMTAISLRKGKETSHAYGLRRTRAMYHASNSPAGQRIPLGIVDLDLTGDSRVGYPLQPTRVPSNVAIGWESDVSRIGK